VKVCVAWTVTAGRLGIPGQHLRRTPGPLIFGTVKIPVKNFITDDLEGRSHCYDLIRWQWIQGLVGRDAHEHEHCIYVVTAGPELEDAIHDRWPRIISR
jgi:hypothetical protein